MTTTTVISRRGLESAIAKWIEERSPSTLVTFPPGIRGSTEGLAAWISWSIETNRMGGPRNAVATVLGAVRIDLFWSRYDSDINVQPAARGSRIEDDVIEVLELASIPSFDVAAFETASGTIKSTTTTMTDSSTSVTLLNVTSLAASGEVTIGAERMTYSSISGSDLIGLTRGVGETTAYAHASGSEVAAELGAEIALIYCEEADVSPLGYDVAAQRMRTLIRVPFTVAYT